MNRRGFIGGLMALIAWPFARRTEKRTEVTKVFVPPKPYSREWQWITLENPIVVKEGETYTVPFAYFDKSFRYGVRVGKETKDA